LENVLTQHYKAAAEQGEVHDKSSLTYNWLED
jgi:hypothetical protein